MLTLLGVLGRSPLPATRAEIRLRKKRAIINLGLCPYCKGHNTLHTIATADTAQCNHCGEQIKINPCSGRPIGHLRPNLTLRTAFIKNRTPPQLQELPFYRLWSN